MQKIAIHSVPRSGSTWLGEIFNSSPVVKYCFQPLFSYKLKDYLDEFSDKASIEIFFRSLLETSDEFICQNLQREMGALTSFRKSASITHVVYKEVRYHHILKNLIEKDKELRLILLVRDPIEVMNSWINSPREFDPSWSINDQLNTAPLKNLGQKENFFGLNAKRNALGFRTNRVSQLDSFEERDLIKGDFNNYGLEIRLLNKYKIRNKDV